MMALQLYMVGLTGQDMEKSKEFYRRLGLAVPEEDPKQPPLMIKMEEDFTLFLAPGSIQSEQASSGERTENYRVLVEYYLKSQALWKQNTQSSSDMVIRAIVPFFCTQTARVTPWSMTPLATQSCLPATQKRQELCMTSDEKH